VNQPVNPYIAGAPVQGEKFFGRGHILRWVEQKLRDPNINALVLFGQRRIGRTSILLQLQHTLPADAFLPIYFDLQDQAACPLGQVLADLADTAAWQAGLDFPVPETPDDQGRFFRREFLPRFYQAMGENRRPVFLLDEFGVLDHAVETELSKNMAARTFNPFLRRVMTEDPRPAFVFAVGRRLEDLSMDFTAIFKRALTQEVWVLEQEEAEALIRQAEANDTLHFTGEAVARILSITQGHPYFTQLLCQRAWEQAYAPQSWATNPSTPPQIDAPEVEATVPNALEAGDQALIWLWNGLGPFEKTCTAALAEMVDKKEELSESQVMRVLNKHAVEAYKRKMKPSPDDMVRRRVLEPAGKRKYRFAVEFLRQWVRRNKPLRDVEDEVDQAARAAAARSKESSVAITGRTIGLLAMLLVDFCLVILWICRLLNQESAFIEILGVSIAVLCWIWSVISEDFLHRLRTDRVLARVIIVLTVLLLLITFILWPRLGG
jgi:hypothetical protein